MKAEDLDKIDDAIKALIDHIEAQGYVGFISYCLQVEDDGTVESQLMSTNARPSHYFLALREWVNMIYEHFLSADKNNNG